MSFAFEVLRLSPECFWGKFDPPTIQFCENNLCGIIAQPANAWSNSAYLLVGVYLLFKTQTKNEKILGWVAIFIGLTSFLYHASFTFLLQFFDLSSMYFFSSFLLTANLIRIGFVKSENHIRLMTTFAVLSMIVLFFFRNWGILIFGVQLILVIYLEYILFRKSNSQTEYKNLIVGLFIFILALFIWSLDLFRVICDRDNHIFQGHAIWHILTALSILFIHKFYFQKVKQGKS